MRLYAKTFGCRVNQSETEAVKERLLSDGATIATDDFETADLCLVNTCTVTREADRDALTLLRRISRRNPAARLVVTGCYATRAPEEIRRAAPSAVVVSNAEKDAIPALVGCRPVPEYAGPGAFGTWTRAFVKVQDGCNMHCAYCIIPSVRPELSCKPYAEVEAEVRRLVSGGHAEIVLCGIRLGRYLVEHEGRRVDFVGLLERLLALPGHFRVRLSSFEVTDVTDRFLDLAERACASGRLCPSFHLPLQSGSEAVLERMERWYSAAFYARRIEALRRRLPDCGLFSDVMAGFPGETEAEFEESLAFVRAMGFSGLHPFRYSRRAGTPAARRAGLPEAVVEERAGRLRALDADLRRAFAAAAVGSSRLVLIEKKGAPAEGFSEHFLRVRLAEAPGPGLRLVRIESAEGWLALGRLASSGR